MSNTLSKKTSSSQKKNQSSTDFNRHDMIAAHAYSLASARGFENGNELEDWFTAEKEIDSQLSR